MPGDPTAWGHWADISFRKYYNTFKEYDRYIDDMPEPITRKLLGVKPKTPKKAKIVTASQTDVVPGVDDGPDEGEDEEDEEEHGDSEEGRMRRKRKNLFYESTAQIRGRPRKYVAVVDEDGQPNRSIVGKLRHSHNLPHVLIYVRNANRLVDGPAGYTGVGPPPILSPTTIARGNPPEHYAQFRQGADGSPRAQKRKKSTGKLGSGKKGNTRPEEEVATSTVVDPNVGYGPEGEMLVDELLDDADITTALQQLGDPAPLTIGTQSITSFIQQPLSVEDSLTAIQAAQSMPVRTDPDVIMRAEPEVTPVGPAKRQRKRKNPGTPAKGDDSGDVTPKLKRGRKATINSTPAVVQPPTPSEPIALAEAEAAVPIEARVAIPPAEQLLSADAHTAPAQEPAVIPRIDGPSTPASSTVAVPSSSADPLYRTKRARQAIPNVRIRTKGRDRVDLGSLRRANEIVQCLVDAGGVLSEPRHFNEHREWALRVAGTDHPHAPVVAASMDRSVYKRILGTLLRDGRLKETTATIPTVTGRWTRASILYTPETPMSVVQDYIRTLTSVSGYTAPVQTKVAATTYTEFRVSKPTTKEASPTPETQGSAANIVDHRAQLFIQPGVAAGLYGYQSGRNVRLRSWHLAILRALQQGSRSMISSSPRVFASTMFFEDIRVVDFFSNIYLQYHTDELEQYLSDAQNLEVRLADMPDNLKPPSFLGIGIRTKFAGLMTGLHELKLVFPLSATDLPSGDVQITESNGKISNFHIVNTTSLATYYMVADIAPVYHIAVDPPNLLGVMPTSDLEQSETYWDRVKAAALVPDRILLEPVSNMIYEESPSIYFPPIVEIPTEHLKMLRSSMRWRAVPKLLSGQQAALNNAIRQDGTQLVVTDEDMAKLAYDNALPLAFVREQLPLMAARLRARLAMRKTRHAEETEKTTERRRKADESLHRKLAARHAAAKVEWERRVNQACAVVGATMSPELLEYVGRQVLASVNRPNYSDEALQGLVRVFQRGQEVAADRATKPPRPEGLPPLKMVFPRAKRSKKMRVVKETIASRTKGPRRRKQWSNEDDENLLDAEAIIRARSRNLPGNKGRQAVSQIFPDVGLQTFRSRLKKIFETAGKKPYFDRLEDAWYNVWQAHKGTPELPDPDPDSVVNFDLSAHIKFLRQKINKANIRLAAVTNTPMQSQAIAPDLPTDVQHLIEEYDWKYNQVTSLKFSLVHDYHVAEEVRTHQLAQISMLDPDSTIEKVDMNDQPQPFQEAVGPDVRVKGVIRVSLLMIVITATEIYAQSDAAGLLDKYNLHTDINPVIAKLVQDKVLHRTPSAAITKRFYDFTASWRQLIEGPYHPELFNEAALVERSLTQGEGEMPWSLLSTGGELAALMHMIGDEHFEFDMRIKRTTSKTPTLPSPPKSEELAPEFIPWSADLPPAPQEIFDQLEPVLFDAGPLGLTKSELQTKLHLSNDELDTVLASLTEENSQLRSCFWTGYDTSRLVHISHWDKWAVPLVSRVIKDGKVEIGGVKLYAPRRWVDIYGTFLEGEYKVALRAVLGHILTRPGITEKTLRTRLEIIVDRLETNDLLQRLLDLGQIQRSWMGESAELRKPLPPIQATDVSEEEDIVLRPALGNPLFIN
ncbi:hypothetical protein M231_00158 [Tremella mesenterica]|uniref:Transcription factor tau subunit sfc3/Tfc3 C-terminal domain-containing protein n=1 Tax=Tremella mesenterica TaxID=5217 RepID=A0A4Q1BWQ5_TREME|nr:hypothetical protein M231_00158 [Tremella mesenterica]